MLRKRQGHATKLIGSFCFCLAILNACSSPPVSADTASNTPRFSAYETVARSKVATQLGVDITEISVVSSQEVQFNDSSLNCPQPGMMYAQVITEGYQVVVSAKEQSYDVRVTGDYALICKTPGSPPTVKRRITR